MNIEGAICRLRALEPQDVDVLYSWENDTALWRVSGTMAPFSRHSLMRFIEEQQYDIYASRQQRLIIETDIDNQPVVVGAIDLFDFDPQNLRAGVGVVISFSQLYMASRSCGSNARRQQIFPSMFMLVVIVRLSYCG